MNTLTNSNNRDNNIDINTKIATNRYSYTLDLVLKLIIDNGFVGLSEFSKLKKVDKYLNKLSNEYINKYYDILKKCHNIEIFSSRYHYYSFIDYNENVIIKYNKNIYEPNYWYNIFNKKLNKDELVLYYGYFINKYNKYYKCSLHSIIWSCIISSDGFIKFLGHDLVFKSYMSDDDIMMKIELYYSISDYRGIKTKYYWKSNIVFKNKKNEKINPTFINVNLLNKLLTDFNYIKMVS